MRRVILRAYKYIAIVAYLFAFGHVLLLLLGCPLGLAEMLVSLSPVAGIFAMALSYVLKYCVLHRVCLLYTTLISSCIWIQEDGCGFGSHLEFAREIAFAIGLVILILLLVKKVRCGYE